MFQSMFKRLRPTIYNTIKRNTEYQRTSKSNLMTVTPHKNSTKNPVFLMSGLLTWLGITSDPNANHDSNLGT